MLPLHLGALHPYEQALTLLLAFGPFVVLGLVVWRRSKEDAKEDAGEDADAAGHVAGQQAEDVAQRD